MPRLASVLSLCLLLIQAGVAYSAKLMVTLDGTADFAAIQGAIDAASEGDTVIVHPGTYYEIVRFEGKSIVLTSLDPNDPGVVGKTIINGGRNGLVVAFTSSEKDTCKLSGFTIANGYAEDGGGIQRGPRPCDMFGAKARIIICT